MKHITGNILLLPLSWLFCSITSIRNFLYNFGILKSTRFELPIICVGNLAAGGTGKTPFSAFLIQKLSSDYKMALLSRGYKRKSKGFVLADSQSTATEIGDEPRQFKQMFPDLTVAVDANRVEGIRKIRNIEPKTEVIVLDDGFQHRKVNPGLKIMLTDYNRLFTRDNVLPYGMLREHRIGYKRADIIVVTKCPESICEREFKEIEEEIRVLPHQQLFFAGWNYGAIYGLYDKAVYSIDDFSAKNLVLMTGIAFPDQAVQYLKSVCLEVDLLRFPDHHFFTLTDYELLLSLITNEKGEIVKSVVVTEKDAARIESDDLFPDQLKNYIYVLPVAMKVLQNKENALIKKILEYVGTDKRDS